MSFLSSLSGLEKLYAVSAVVGGIMFVVRVVLQFIGGMGDAGDVDAGGMDAGGVDGDGDFVGDTHAAASDHSFTVLSFQGLTAFFMMFGLVGLAIHRQTPYGALASLLGGLAAGAVTVWIIGHIFLSMRRLQADGTLNFENAVGQEGRVYLRIPSGGTGKVEVGVQGRLQVLDAVSDAQAQLETGERVRVVRVVRGNVMVVEKL